MFADEKVYEQSKNLIVKAADLYYNQGMSQVEIGHQLDVSAPTVSRLLKKAREKKIVSFQIPESYLSCLEMERQLREKYQLNEVIIALSDDQDRDDPETIKMNVALEGARYIQRILQPHDTLGIAWGRTIYYVIHYLNPSQKIDANFISLNGNMTRLDPKLDASSLVVRAAMAFGGTRHNLTCDGLQKDEETAKKVCQRPDVKRVFEMFSHTTISVSGLGCLYPLQDSPLWKMGYLTEEEMVFLTQTTAYGDLMLRFFDKDGAECSASLSKRTIAIDLETYRNIPTKIIVASGAFKVDTLLAVIKGRLVDVLIIDEMLARALFARDV